MKRIFHLLIFSLLFSSVGYPQNVVRFGIASTENHVAAFSGKVVLNTNPVDTTFKKRYFVSTSENSWLNIYPSLDIIGGMADANTGLSLKINAAFNVFKLKTFEDIGEKVPDRKKTYYAFPIAAGIETSPSETGLNVFNAVFEGGIIPHFKGRGINTFLKYLNTSLFVQAGTKLYQGDFTLITGGKANESLEQKGKAILRVNGNIGLDTKELPFGETLKFGLSGNGSAWYDIANGGLYTAYNITFSMYLAPGISADLFTEEGSKAPLFNKARQTGFGVRLIL